MMTTRRKFLASGAALATGAAAMAAGGKASAEATAASAQWDESYSGGPVDRPTLPPGLPGRDYKPVVTPSGGSLEWKIVDGVKVFHLVAEEIDHEFTPGLNALCWGYSGRVNGTTIEAVEGERVRIYVTNKLPAPTTVHWHGLYLPNGMDGVSGLTQKPIPPGETFKYEWTLRQHGTFMYHSHHDTMTQEGMGLIGMFIIHPRDPDPDQIVDRDFVLILAEYRVDPDTRRPNPLENSDYNVLTMNGKCFPGLDSLVAKTGDKVRIRIGNLSQMNHHPIHLHGYRFRVTATDGERLPLSAQWPETTVLLAVGQTREIELIADAPGDWAMHCHMTHHTMNQMGHNLPNMVGVEPGDLDRKVRQFLPGYMTMGQTGMGGMDMSGDMSDMGDRGMDHGETAMPGGAMALPKNTIAMRKIEGAFAPLSAGGMFTVFKVRDRLSSYDDPGWYRHPPGTVADKASAAELRRDKINISQT